MLPKTIFFNAERWCVAPGYPTGTWLIDHLPPEAVAAAPAVMLWPVGHDLTQAEIDHWCHKHLIFDDLTGRIIAVFHGDNIYWEAS